MKAIVVIDEAAGPAGMTLVDRPGPEAGINDVIVQVHALVHVRRVDLALDLDRSLRARPQAGNSGMPLPPATPPR